MQKDLYSNAFNLSIWHHSCIFNVVTRCLFADTKCGIMPLWMDGWSSVLMRGRVFYRNCSKFQEILANEVMLTAASPISSPKISIFINASLPTSSFEIFNFRSSNLDVLSLGTSSLDTLPHLELPTLSNKYSKSWFLAFSTTPALLLFPTNLMKTQLLRTYFIQAHDSYIYKSKAKQWNAK